MIELQIINAQNKVKPGEDYIRKLREFLQHVLDNEQDAAPQELKQINIILVDNEYISQLNEKYLGRKGPTDVLSFDLGEIAEIYVSAEYDPSSIHHFALHGLLHVLGYDHKIPEDARIMRAKEESFLKLWVYHG